MSNKTIETGIDYSEQMDYSVAKYTAVVSDLHLCEAEPPNPRHPLWKKFKSREFFFDEEFALFIKHIQKEGKDHSVELVLNGDVFDFDSVSSLPVDPTFKISWLESRRGLDSEKEKSIYKIEVILRDHPIWVQAVSSFIKEGHRVIFVFGNHDLELSWIDVQKKILETMGLDNDQRRRVRFVEWFYISNKDTLIEHGHQHDPYCVNQDPINPVVIDYNRLMVRLPFGDLACRYLSNGMGFFNPHVDANFLMSVPEYIKVFFKYMVRAQPLLIWTYFWSSLVIFVQTVRHGTLKELQNPLTVEDRVEEIAQKANATSRMVRELQALFSKTVAASPWKVLRELWLDRVFILMVGLLALLYLFLVIDRIYSISFYWMFIPIALLLPPYVLYSRSVYSYVGYYKRPDEEILSMAGMITGVKRIVFGHTHILRHEMIGAIEHLNPGTWSPAFLDIECTQFQGQKAFVWICPSGEENIRQAKLLNIKDNQVSVTRT
jgi:UDP-2,3-diacylglucosamine pyrophosphatase LpxH